MRKKISCRVIESVPLNQSGDGLHRTYPDKSKISDFNARSHQDVPSIMRIYFDNTPIEEMLNIQA